MAEWRPIHKPLDLRSGLETGGKFYDPPLLPYEIALIEALGCTEEEYKIFVRYAAQRAYTRPAEYENIPEIYAIFDPVSGAIAAVSAISAASSAKAVATTIAINVAIGLALTAVSILLAPKAPALEAPAKIRGKKLADQIGPTRFNQTTSFDNVSSLAEYAQPIPIPFGRRGIGTDDAVTGGLILAPALVWSRTYSYGNYQAFEGIYVAGEYGINTPQVSGVRLGTFALDTLGDREYALFWSSQEGTNFPQTLISGTDSPGQAVGTSGRTVFTAPDSNGQFERAASTSYNLRSQFQFGTATPIHNGTAYRFNWEIISAPFSSTKGEDYDEARFETRAKRRKIAGAAADILHDDKNPGVGMPGVGRAYSRRMGFIGLNHNEVPNRQIATVDIGDLAIFEIYKEGWKEFQKDDFSYNGKRTQVKLQDLANSARSWRERASDLLTVGSRWIIGACVWVVEDRREVSDKQTHIYFRCVSIFGPPTLGIAGTRTIREPLGGYDGLEYNEEKHCGANWWTVCRLYMSNIRPVRRDCRAIEFGIKSQVWNRAAGLCNFNALPTPAKLFALDEKDITLTTPRMDKYFDRTSCFSVYVRPVAKYGEPEHQWQRLVPASAEISGVFCVIGRAPIDQYNYLRIKPRVEGYYEYRFIPRTGTDVGQYSDRAKSAIRLTAEAGEVIGEDYVTPYGNFRVTTTGKKVLIEDIIPNDEMFTAPGDEDNDPYPNANITKTGPSAVTQSAASTVPAGGQFVLNAWFTHYLGEAWEQRDATRSFTISMTKTNDPSKTLKLKVTATSLRGTIGIDVGQPYVDLTGSKYKWSNVTYEVLNFSGKWGVGDTIKDEVIVSSFVKPNIFAIGFDTVNIQFACTAIGNTIISARKVSQAERVFEQSSQVADCSHFLELQKSNESNPEHEIVYVNEFTDNLEPPTYYNMSTIGLAVKSSGQVNSVEQLRLWVPTGINVHRLIEQDTAPSNLFADLVYYLLTSNSQGVGNVVPSELVDAESLTTTARFLRANKIFFDGVLEDTSSLRSFLYDTASLQLCNFTIKNGRFGMMPALPYDSSYQISTAPVAIEQIFTSGNIIQDSLQVQYIDAAQRANFRAIVNWRVTVENDLPAQGSVLVDWADIPESSRATTQQSFDLTDFCTNRAQALLTARFLLSIRRRVTHTVSFKTIPDALGIQPGSYIRVITESTTYSATNNGGITDAGSLVSISSIEDGAYDALVYNPQTGDITEQRITISNSTVSDPSLYGCLFTLVSLQVSAGVYQVEQLTLDEDGLVNISAVHVPVDSTGASIVAKDVLTEGNFRVLE